MPSEEIVKAGIHNGIVTFSKNEVVYVMVGGRGMNGINSVAVANGGFNGGGNGYNSANVGAGGGGGATDMRIGVDDLYARVIVAGGGGGASGASASGVAGGAGGGTGGGGNFGVGSSGAENTYAGGGGGGWYGGSGGTRVGTSGKGGSGYVFTSLTASSYPGGCKLTSAYYLTGDATTTAGQRSGDGQASITLIE